MLLGKLVKVFFDGQYGNVNILALIFLPLQLQQQTFLQVTGGHSGGIKILYPLNDLFHFFFGGRDILAEGQVIYDCWGLPSQVAIFIYASYNLFCYFMFLFIQFQQTQLK